MKPLSVGMSVKDLFTQRLLQAREHSHFYLRDFVDHWALDFMGYLLNRGVKEHLAVERFSTMYPSSHVLAWELVHHWGMEPLLIKTRVDGSIGAGFFASDEVTAFLTSVDYRHEGKRFEEMTEEEWKSYKQHLQSFVEISDEELADMVMFAPDLLKDPAKLLGLETDFVMLVGPSSRVRMMREAMEHEVHLSIPMYKNVYVSPEFGLMDRELPLVVRFREFPVENEEDLVLFYPWIRDYGWKSVQELAERYAENPEPFLFLYGMPGTGKTLLGQWVARLLWEMDGGSWEMYAVSPMVWLRVDTDTLMNHLSGGKMVVLADEMESVLSGGKENQQLATLLHYSGFVQPGLKMILTVNTHTEIHPALLRAGRTFMVMKARPHTEEEARAFLARYGGDFDRFRETFDGYTIANLVKFLRMGRHVAESPEVRKTGFLPSSAGEG